MTTTRVSVELLDLASLFLHVATRGDIEEERELMEARYRRKLKVHLIEYPTHSGARCTRVTWECID